MRERETKRRRDAERRGGFTLVELLVVISVVALLLSILLPSLAGARAGGRGAACLSNLRQLTTGWAMYAGQYGGRAMPAADDRTAEVVYWWGQLRLGPPVRVEHEPGFLAPFLEAGLAERSVYECPAQPWGSYRAQPTGVLPPGSPTSTYGYNGFGLSPPSTGWNADIRRQRWLRVEDIVRPTELFVFADAMLGLIPVRNTALLDPPVMFEGGVWVTNPFPTTCFRHAQSASAARADGSVRAERARPEWLSAPALKIGSVGRANDPHYVEDWRRWR